MQIKKTKGIILYVIGGLIFLGAMSGFIYYYNLTNEVSAAREQKETELRNAITKIKNLPKLKEEVAALEEEELKLAEYIPSKEGQAEFVWQLQELAGQSGVTITKCTIEKDSKEYVDTKIYKVFQWKVSISGKYQGVIHFLELLPLAKRSAMVSNLQVSSEPNDDNPGDYILKADMTLDLITSAGEKVTK